MVKKARKGDALKIEARDWNRLADIANRFGSQSTAGSQQIAPDVVWVKNTLGRDLDVFAAVCIGSPLLVESTTLQIDPIFSLVNSSLRGQQSYGQADPIVGILQEPIESNRFGLVRVSGVTPATVINTEGNTAGGNSNIPEYATISDDKDSLAFCEFGPIRVLQRNLSANAAGNFSSGKYMLVCIGEPSNLGSCELTYTTDWTENPNESRTWSTAVGDLMRLGVHGDGEDGSLKPTGKLYISRPGRYQVITEWRFTLESAPTWVTGDWLSWRINWASTEVEYGSCPIHSWAGSGGALGSIPGGFGAQISGQKSFYYTLTGNAMQQEIQTPGIEAIKIPASGSATSVGVTGAGRVRVVRFGPAGQSSGGTNAWTSYWTKAKRDASWARGATDGPI